MVTSSSGCKRTRKRIRESTTSCPTMATSSSRRTIPPTEPHFFQFLLPGFLEKFLIPIKFAVIYLGGDEHEDGPCKNGVLRSNSGKRWPVKIKGRRIESGWVEFAVAHNLQAADFVVFRHTGDLVFQVMVYKPSGCETVYPVEEDDQGPQMAEAESLHVNPADKVFDPSSCERGSPTLADQVGEDDQDLHLLRAEGLDAIPAHEVFDPSSSETGSSPLADQVEEDGHDLLRAEILDVKPAIVKNINVTKKKTNITRARSRADSPPQHKRTTSVFILCSSDMLRLNIPISFARINGLSGRQCGIELRDQTGRSWPGRLYYNKTRRQTRIGSGWHQLRAANGFKKGDSIRFELVNGAKPIINICGASKEVMTENQVGVGPRLAASDPRLLEHPHFRGILKHANFREKILAIPASFAKANNLRNRRCAMILRDQNGRSWPVRLLYRGHGQVYIGCGWHDFQAANGLKKGDSFIFELVNSGRKPVANIYVGKLKSQEAKSPVRRRLLRRASTSQAEAVSPTFQVSSFVKTLTKHCLRHSQLNIPMKFARAGGLCKKNCQLILEGQNKRSWTVVLRHVESTGLVYLASGFKKFGAENGLKAGDSVKFELVKGGSKLIMKFHGKVEAEL